MTKRAKPRRNRPEAQKSKKWLYINIALAVGLMAIAAGVLLWAGQESTKPLPTPDRYARQRDNAMENFTLKSLDGADINLRDYDGQVVLLNFWATWCPPCTAELPDIDAFYNAHKDEGFVVIAVNAQEDAQTVDAFIKAKGFNFPVALDSQASLMQRYSVRGLPTTFILDRDGVIRHTQSGVITQQQLEDIIGPLL